MGKIEKAMMNITSAAELMGLQEDELRDLIDNGDIQAFGSQKTLIRKSDLYKFLGEKPDENTIEREEASALSSCNKVYEGDDMRESKARPYYNNRRRCYQMSPYIECADGKKRITVSGATEEEVLNKVRVIQQQAYYRAETEPMVGYQPIKRCTMAQLADEWFEMKHAKVKEATIESYSPPYKEIRDLLGDMYVDEVDFRDIEKYFQWKREQRGEEFSDSTYKIRRKVLSEMFQYAEKCKYLVRGGNPMKDRPDIPKGIPANREDRYLGKEQVQALMEALKPNKQYYTIAFVLFTTGMRIGELCALQWKDIVPSLSKNGDIYYAINVERAMTKNKNFIPNSDENRRYVVGDTKTTCGVRKIYIKKDVYDVLQQWKEYMESDSELAHKRAVNKTKGYVFVNRNGQTINSNSLRNTMNRYLKKRAEQMESSGEYDAQEIRIRFHDLRHTFASLLLAAGTDIVTTSRILGHSSIKITGDYYITVTDKKLEDGADKVAEIALAAI